MLELVVRIWIGHCKTENKYFSWFHTIRHSIVYYIFLSWLPFSYLSVTFSISILNFSYYAILYRYFYDLILDLHFSVAQSRLLVSLKWKKLVAYPGFKRFLRIKSIQHMMHVENKTVSKHKIYINLKTMATSLQEKCTAK